MYDVKAVYLVAFLNFRQPDIGSEFRTDVALMNMQTQQLFSDKLRLIYLQLPYFVKEADDCENDFDRWIYVLKNMETFNRLPWTAQKSVFQRLAEIADVSSMTKEERLKYDEGLRKYRDTLSVMEGARLKGREEGREEGRAEERAELARMMLQNGEPVDKVIKYTKLSAEEIKALLP